VKYPTVAFIFLLVVLPCQAQIITIDDDGPVDFNSTKAAVRDRNDNDGDITEVGPRTETD
jgi:hypothetical protein